MIVNNRYDGYFLGLDIGTSSLGWAVTDQNYNILEYRRRAMWGIHLFDEGKTAADRRMHRVARRRLNRRKQRITLLRELFSKEIFEADPSFFERLDDSGLFMEDRRTNQPNSLFNDPEFQDKDYHRKFPTAYHLRKYLMTTDEMPDIRLLYLGIHHIIKYRGHFLFGTTTESVPKFADVMDILSEDVRKYGLEFTILNLEGLENSLKERVSVMDKKKKVAELLGCDTPESKEFANLISGGKVTLSKLFGDDSLNDEKICFKPEFIS